MTKLERKATGRPPIAEGERTIRAGFTVQESLFRLLMDEAERRGVSYSEVCRNALEAFLRPDKGN